MNNTTVINLLIMEGPFITRKELAAELKIDVKTLRKWLKIKNVSLEPGKISKKKYQEIKFKLGII